MKDDRCPVTCAEILIGKVMRCAVYPNELVRVIGVFISNATLMTTIEFENGDSLNTSLASLMVQYEPTFGEATPTAMFFDEASRLYGNADFEGANCLWQDVHGSLYVINSCHYDIFLNVNLVLEALDTPDAECDPDGEVIAINAGLAHPDDLVKYFRRIK